MKKINIISNSSVFFIHPRGMTIINSKSMELVWENFFLEILNESISVSLS